MDLPLDVMVELYYDYCWDDIMTTGETSVRSGRALAALHSPAARLATSARPGRSTHTAWATCRGTAHTSEHSTVVWLARHKAAACIKALCRDNSG